MKKRYMEQNFEFCHGLLCAYEQFRLFSDPRAILEGREYPYNGEDQVKKLKKYIKCNKENIKSPEHLKFLLSWFYEKVGGDRLRELIDLVSKYVGAKDWTKLLYDLDDFCWESVCREAETAFEEGVEYGRSSWSKKRPSYVERARKKLLQSRKNFKSLDVIDFKKAMPHAADALGYIGDVFHGKQSRSWQRTEIIMVEVFSYHVVLMECCYLDELTRRHSSKREKEIMKRLGALVERYKKYRDKVAYAIPNFRHANCIKFDKDVKKWKLLIKQISAEMYLYADASTLYAVEHLFSRDS